ncbi:MULTISPECIES: Lsr2 family protein [unclassified Pseudactinotalea]|uniref:histone-like nucleoid-structuring protein Lsr2 n=1 Tax=unclassified Pseudactinotalea TaxID=2649176 RepID=UPI00128C23B3|nr:MULTISPECIES: Lsr2 family protein [unclassified Pseudactinotalea]MPV49003.1 Lsr2 family protein [Pseudactinotalea sp. HY160]QGH68321.1 Lsr2 family protein [Pseudactinotalea sp. HY158]
MATVESITLIDDIDGSAAERTVHFALDGMEYAIDLSRANRNALVRDLARFITVARRVDGAGPQLRVAETDADPRAVREWARSHGIAVPEGRRLPRSVIDQFVAAGN